MAALGFEPGADTAVASLGTFSSHFTELAGMPPSTYHLPAARDGGNAAMRGEAGEQTDQESRSAGH